MVVTELQTVGSTHQMVVTELQTVGYSNVAADCTAFQRLSHPSSGSFNTNKLFVKYARGHFALLLIKLN